MDAREATRRYRERRRRDKANGIDYRKLTTTRQRATARPTTGRNESGHYLPPSSGHRADE
tara:strand:- start:721 stop:900 length:180 start_codon:yes stop_codon:yes gene_type:complete